MRTYKAILHGDHVEWIDAPSDKTYATRVLITILEEPEEGSSQERGRIIAESRAALAEMGAFSAITNADAWQREQRRDRALLHEQS